MISFTGSENHVLDNIIVAAAAGKKHLQQTILVRYHTSQLKISLHKQRTPKVLYSRENALWCCQCGFGRIVLMKIQIQQSQKKNGISEFNLKRNSDLALFNLSSVESSLGTLRLHFQTGIYICVCKQTCIISVYIKNYINPTSTSAITNAHSWGFKYADR